MGALHIAKKETRGVIRHHAIQIFARVGAGEVENGSSSLKTSPGGSGLVSLHGKEKSFRAELSEDGDQGAGLAFCVHAGGVSQGGFRPKID